MTTIRRNQKPTVEETPVTEAIVTANTHTVKVIDDPSVLYPPKSARSAISPEPILLSETLPERQPLWRKLLPAIPILLGIVLVVVTIVALNLR